jgi:hypothetical protein
MPKQKTLPLPERTGNCSNACEQKRQLFAKMALLWSKELTEDLLLLWDEILKGYSVDEVDYAVEHWMRNGHFWPKPADILQLVSVYREDKRYLKIPRYENHGQGYGEKDIKILWHLMAKRRAYLQGPLGEEDTAILLDELDEMTGRA